MAKYVGLGTLITPHGCEVDVGGVVPNDKFVHKPESKFLSGQAKYSQPHERLGSCPVMERLMMKSSRLLQCGPLPPYVHLVTT